MAIRFSRVSAMTTNTAAIFLVSGIPADQADLDHWTAFKSFTKDLPKDTVISCTIETFLYGEEEILDATPEEVAYMYKRIDMRPDFLDKRTKKIDESSLILWLNK